MSKTKIDRVQIVDLPKFTDGKGNLSFIEGGRHVPFEIKRIYYLYHVPDGQIRGQHAHKKLRQLILAVHGSFEVALDDGKGRKDSVRLDSPDRGLLVENVVWREISDFSPGAVCLVLASEPYEEEDYFRNYEDFVVAVNKNEEDEDRGTEGESA